MTNNTTNTNTNKTNTNKTNKTLDNNLDINNIITKLGDNVKVIDSKGDLRCGTILSPNHSCDKKPLKLNHKRRLYTRNCTKHGGKRQKTMYYNEIEQDHNIAEQNLRHGGGVSVPYVPHTCTSVGGDTNMSGTSNGGYSDMGSSST